MHFDDRPIRQTAPLPASMFALRALAIAHFFFAALILTTFFLDNATEGSNVDEQLATSLNKVDSAPAQALGKRLQRTSEIKDSIRKNLASRAPSSAWVNPLNQTVEVGLAFLAIAAGVCLYQQQPMGRPLSLAFGGACLAQKLVFAGYLGYVTVPAASKFGEQLLRLYPADKEIIQGVLAPITNGPVVQLVLAIFPIVILAMMWQPGVKSALAARLEPTKRPTERETARLVPPPVQMLVTSLETPVDDPLTAMLQKKTF